MKTVPTAALDGASEVIEQYRSHVRRLRECLERIVSEADYCGPAGITVAVLRSRIDEARRLLIGKTRERITVQKLV